VNQAENLTQFGTGQRAVMLCSQEGNRRSGVALAMCHRLLLFIHLRAHGHRKGDEHPTYTPYWGMVHFTFRGSAPGPRLRLDPQIPLKARAPVLAMSPHFHIASDTDVHRCTEKQVLQAKITKKHFRLVITKANNQ